MKQFQVKFIKAKREDRMGVSSPYSAYFVEKIKGLGVNHVWNANSKMWFFDASGIEKVRALLLETFTDRAWESTDRALTVENIDGSVETYGALAEESATEESWGKWPTDGEKFAALNNEYSQGWQ